jgi:DNA-binding NarL/FixJ family response regulator
MYAMPTPRFHVVVADDGDDMRELIVAALELSGSFIVVGRAGDGAEAIAEVERRRPDLAVIDLAMPGVSGLEAIPGIRAASPATKVVVVSGFPRGRLADAVAARGATGYVEKGLSPTRMVDEIISVAGVLRTSSRPCSTSGGRNWQPTSAAVRVPGASWRRRCGAGSAVTSST